MNKKVNKCLLAGEICMPEMHLKQPRFKEFKNLKKTTNYIYKNELDKAFFQHDMAHGDFKDSARRTASDKVLRDKVSNIDGYQGGLPSMAYQLFHEMSAGSATPIADKHAFNNEIKQNMLLAEELHKPIIKEFEKRKVYSAFKDNIWIADLADMLPITKLIKDLLCVIDIFSKYAWVVPLKDKNCLRYVFWNVSHFKRSLINQSVNHTRYGETM